MFDEISSELMTILTTSFCGVSLATVIGFVITFFVQVKKNKNAINVTKESVELAFQSAVLPKTVKLDLSNKIEVPLREGFQKLENAVSEKFTRIERGQVLILTVLNQLNHVNKLPQNVRDEITSFISDDNAVTVLV